MIQQSLRNVITVYGMCRTEGGVMRLERRGEKLVETTEEVVFQKNRK